MSKKSHGTLDYGTSQPAADLEQWTEPGNLISAIWAFICCVCVYIAILIPRTSVWWIAVNRCSNFLKWCMSPDVIEFGTLICNSFGNLNKQNDDTKC